MLLARISSEIEIESAPICGCANSFRFGWGVVWISRLVNLIFERSLAFLKFQFPALVHFISCFILTKNLIKLSFNYFFISPTEIESLKSPTLRMLVTSCVRKNTARIMSSKRISKVSQIHRVTRNRNSQLATVIPVFIRKRLPHHLKCNMRTKLVKP